MDMDTPRPTAREIHEILYDGADIEVTHRDGGTEMVKVRKIPRKDYSTYGLLVGEVSGDEAAECAFYCGRDEAWARSLDDASFDRVLEEGHRLNFLPFGNWFARQSRKLGLVNQQKEIVDQAARILSERPNLKTLLAPTNGSSTRAT